MLYVAETFTEEEAAILRPYFTNLDGPVFALVNLPEVVKGALFARYSRSSKSLRRLFLDEFVADLDLTGDLTVDASVGLRRAEDLYEKVFVEYGDDSVAQLGATHLACEQASNVLTKILEWGRLASYLEQSTRYIPYDIRLGGRYRYLRPPSILDSPIGARYVSDMDHMFDLYAQSLPTLTEWARERYPKDPSDSDFVYKQTIKAKACDAARGMLPAATLSNLGIFASGQAYEALLLRMRAHPLPEARTYSSLMLEELQKVIPSFLSRVDRPERGGVWSRYFDETREATQALSDRVFGSDSEPCLGPSVQLVDFDPNGETNVAAAALFSVSHLSESTLRERVARMTDEERGDVIATYNGERLNRRHRPGRAFEATTYRFEIVGDYGAFRDLQRHRMLTVDWQQLDTEHGYEVPEGIDEAGLLPVFEEAMECSHELTAAIRERSPNEAVYGVALAHRLRYIMEMNAREAMHLIELRSGGQGHPSYRWVAQQMHQHISATAGHRHIAAAMNFVDYDSSGLERLESERRAEARRSAASANLR